MAERRIILGKDPAIPANDYIISTIITNSTPLAVKARLVQHPDDADGDYSFTRDTQGNAEFSVRIMIEGTDPADTQVTIDSILAQVVALRSGEVKYEYDAGSKRFELPLSFVQSFSAEATLRAKENAAIIDIVFTSEQLDPDISENPEGGPPGAISPLTWVIATNPQGYSRALGEVVFKDRTSALDWINGLLAGGANPALPFWMKNNDTWRLFSHEITTDERASGFGGSVDHVVKVEMRQQVSEFVSLGALDDFRDIGYTLVKSERPPNSGNRLGLTGPGHNIILSGQLTPKVGKLEDFNTGDSTAVDVKTLDSKIRQALDALVNDSNDRLPHKWRELTRQYEVDARDSEIKFVIKGILTDLNLKEIEIHERVLMRYVPQEEDVHISDGVVRTFSDITGMQVILEHTYRVQSFRRPTYRMPQVAGGTWRANPGAIPEPIADQAQDGETIWKLDVKTTWRRLPQSPGEAIQAPVLGSTLTAKGLQSG